NVVGTLLILAMAIAVNADVLGRNAFNRPIPGVTEFIGLSIVAVVFLQMANTLREDRHVSNDVFFGVLSRAYPRVADALNVAFNIIGALLLSMIVIYVWPIVRENYAGDYYAGTAGLIEIPIWPFMAAIVVGSAATACQFLVGAWLALRRLRAHGMGGS
ncbi:MAG: TRAP transporter small permease, partial [Proteobacteria bacterium]|nr:TRAP transporter small permease [Pseudomonadota bacterium]